MTHRPTSQSPSSIRVLHRCFAVALLAVLSAACGSAGSPAGTVDAGDASGALPCTAGQIVACPCLGGGQGTQTCERSGAFGMCNCPATDAGVMDVVDAGARDADPGDAASPDIGTADTALDVVLAADRGEGDAPDVVDAADAVDVIDVVDALDAADAVDVIDVVDALDAADAVDVIDVVDALDAADVVDVVDVVAMTDAVDVVDVCAAATSSDPANCGTCGHACTVLAHAAAICTAGVCGFRCDLGHEDCDGLAANGCEVDLTSDPANCGTCRASCGRPNATGRCASGTCAGFACASGYGDCDGDAANGCEVDLRVTTARCGACDRACAAPLGGTVSCVASACVPACEPGFGVAAGACVRVDPPRPLAPLSTAVVTSRQPTLRWALVPGTTGARVQICRDRACATVEQTVDASGTSATPTANLSAGVHYWRAFGKIGAAAGLEAGPVWEFFVGARTATSRSTSWGAAPDFDGDGYADLAVGAREYVVGGVVGVGRVYVYRGGAGGVPASPTWTIESPDAPDPGGYVAFGRSIANAGDVNGDGYGDLVVGANLLHNSSGRAYVYLGGPSGLSAGAIALPAPDVRGGFGTAVAGLGDINGDGYGDFVVGAPIGISDRGRAHVYFGRAAGPATTPSLTINGPEAGTNTFANSLADAGDVNGDGYGDLVIGDFGAAGDVGQARLYLGGSAGLPSTPSLTLTGLDGAGGAFGIDVANAGDVNGDGYADLAVGAQSGMSSTGRVYIFRGGAGGTSTSPTTTITGPDGMGTIFGGSLAGAGDLNGDGYDDLLVGASFYSSRTGRVYAYHGSAGGLATTPGTVITGRDGTGAGFGSSVAIAGDVNGDGYADVAVGASSVGGDVGVAYVFPGGALGVANDPSRTLQAPGGIRGLFGFPVVQLDPDRVRWRSPTRRPSATYSG